MWRFIVSIHFNARSLTLQSELITHTLTHPTLNPSHSHTFSVHWLKNRNISDDDNIILSMTCMFIPNFHLRSTYEQTKSCIFVSSLYSHCWHGCVAERNINMIVPLTLKISVVMLKYLSDDNQTICFIQLTYVTQRVNKNTCLFLNVDRIITSEKSYE